MQYKFINKMMLLDYLLCECVFLIQSPLGAIVTCMYFREKQRLKEIQVKSKTASMAAEFEDWCHLVDKQNRLVCNKVMF